MSMPFEFGAKYFEYQEKRSSRYRRIAMAIGATVCGVSTLVYRSAEQLSDTEAYSGLTMFVSGLATAIVAFDEYQARQTSAPGSPENGDDGGGGGRGPDDVPPSEPAPGGGGKQLVAEVESYLRQLDVELVHSTGSR